MIERIADDFMRTFQKMLFRLRHHWLTGGTLRKLAWTAQGARIGPGTIVPRLFMTWPHQVQIGADCTLEQDIFFKYDGFWQPGPSIRIGDQCFIGRGCEFNIKRAIAVGPRSLIASGCKFIDHDHDIPPADEGDVGGAGPEAAIRLGENVWLGANAIVLKGVEIGSGSVVAAGAVVTKSIAPNEIWAGVPARRIGGRGRASVPVGAEYARDHQHIS